MNNKYSLPKDGGLIAKSAPRDIIHRYEKIRTNVYENEYRAVQYVADNIVRAIRNYNEAHCSNGVYDETRPFVLGLTTGRTPLGLYSELVKRHKEGQISFRNVAVFSLDEFYPIRSTEQQSRNYRIHEEFLNHIDILPENIHIPDGTVPESRISRYCESYDRAINHIDLMIIGVGEQGQLGFNEPGSYEKSRTRLVQLSHDSRKIQSSAFSGIDDTPKMAITMGIDTIMRADKIVLMAWGEEKADVIVANIIADVICYLCGPVKKHLLEGGTFICSGIIREREEDVQRALAAAGYTVCNRLAKGEWVCLAAKLAA